MGHPLQITREDKQGLLAGVSNYSVCLLIMREKDNPSLEMTPNIDQIVQDTFQLRESCFSDHCQLHCDWPRLHSGSASSSGSSGEDVDGLPVYGGQARSQRIPPFIGRHQRPRPQITLRYTQTIDGSLVASDAEPLQIDDPYSTQLINRYSARVAKGGQPQLC